MRSLPLAGITVVSLEQAVAAPFATRQLADLGARVIKVERPSGDFARDYDGKVRGMSSNFVWLNRSKESIVLDLKELSDVAFLNQLIAKADVFVQNLAPGAVERLGIGPDRAIALNPTIIYASIAGYGTEGPYGAKKAYDLLMQCEAGLLSVTGTAQEPAKAGIAIADIAAGMYTYSGILAALFHRMKTGEGEILEITMLDALGEWMMFPYLYTEYGGEEQIRSGAFHATIAPYGPFPASDGTVFFGVQNEREWERFCTTVLLEPSILTENIFRGNSARLRNRDQLHALIAETMTSLTCEEVLRRLDEAEIANAKLRTLRDFSQHPQLLARDRWREVDSPVGKVRIIKPPVNGSNTEYQFGRIPEIGEDSEQIRAEFSD